ncbi:hypothetical protein DM02DRAFT_733644 [Periconia macrospinosa]|uniref:Altered inheritance of mitochondria protein 9, mitochondrial n=1 Tax=Periconia macrospinosa TaxID=97972 RepID=A0A2V1D3E3_9PLEO|nr:hypothetical protein DM02DRAFT_733644 [Periconia macrospinosa]
MKHAHGFPLNQKWPNMDVTDQIQCVSAICKSLQEVDNVKFSRYGSLYFTDTAHITTPRLLVDSEFFIEPHCGSRYWDCNIRQPKYYHAVNPNQGPWSDLTAHCDGLIDTGISRIPLGDAVFKQPRYHGSPQTHRELLEHGRSVIKSMMKSPRLSSVSSLVLFHPDLHKRNIFVSNNDPTIITAIVDWQSSSIEPAFWYANQVSDFAQPVLDPSSDDQLEPKSEACAKAFNVSTQFLLPRLSQPRLMDETLFRPFRYCYRTWEDGAVAFREELIQTARNWDGLGIVGSCPFSILNPDEGAAHRKDYKLFETV